MLGRLGWVIRVIRVRRDLGNLLKMVGSAGTGSFISVQWSANTQSHTARHSHTQSQTVTHTVSHAQDRACSRLLTHQYQC